MPIITIFGVTGTRVRSAVIDAVLADGKYTPRAVSHSLDTDASKALKARGVEVVVGNLFDKDSLKKAIQGSKVVFGEKVTNFWDPAVYPADATGKSEIEQEKNLVDAAKEVDVKFFIWRSHKDSTNTSATMIVRIFKVHCANSQRLGADKAMVEAYLRASGVPFAVLHTGRFGENLWKFGVLAKIDTGYSIAIPQFDANDVQSATCQWVRHDFGTAAVALLTNYTDKTKGVLGKVYPVVSLRFTYTELAAAFTTAINKEVKFIQVESAGIAEVDEMFLSQAKTPAFKIIPFPNPDLIAFGVKFTTLDEFVQKEIHPGNFSPPTSGPTTQEVVQYYRASSVALMLDGYNNTAYFLTSTDDTPLPESVDKEFLACLNFTIGAAVPLVDAPSKKLSHKDIAWIVIGCVVGTAGALLRLEKEFDFCK
ncbi:hypothetical protein DFH08DRAFT_1089644 [Mycena albidolilacea]|uniref:NmrA-like domain-containing protein n=1 Tax=Mycena albidolilacea TaxID=1033008 RepID=A0AAD6Z0F4_9AGAR|nr:hypothetical protein DFH08DRAFT_1089644 [Mycena albidolilacea]